MNKMACLVLAAGEGLRFGLKKQLVHIDRVPMINKVLLEVKSIFEKDLFVVVGAFKEEVISVVGDLAHPIVNDNWSKGLGSSISVGVKKISNDQKYDSLLIVLADQVALKKCDYELLISCFDGKKVVATKYEDSLGVPAVFSVKYFERLERLSGEIGAKSILNQVNISVTGVELTGSLIDIDTRKDLSKYLES